MTLSLFAAALSGVLILTASSSVAETIRIPGISPDAAQNAPPTPVCKNAPHTQDHCVRVLACVGDQGLYFDGHAYGWDRGRVEGTISDNTVCTGTWDSDGPMGAGISELNCSDDRQVKVIYYTQDNDTGTVIGKGTDSQGQMISVWTGLLVNDYLSKNGRVTLPCSQGDLPIS